MSRKRGTFVGQTGSGGDWCGRHRNQVSWLALTSGNGRCHSWSCNNDAARSAVPTMKHCNLYCLPYEYYFRIGGCPNFVFIITFSLLIRLAFILFFILSVSIVIYLCGELKDRVKERTRTRHIPGSDALTNWAKNTIILFTFLQSITHNSCCKAISYSQTCVVHTNYYKYKSVFVCLSVWRSITQKLQNRFQWKFGTKMGTSEWHGLNYVSTLFFHFKMAALFVKSLHVKRYIL